MKHNENHEKNKKKQKNNEFTNYSNLWIHIGIDCEFMLFLFLFLFWFFSWFFAVLHVCFIVFHGFPKPWNFCYVHNENYENIKNNRKKTWKFMNNHETRTPHSPVFCIYIYICAVYEKITNVRATLSIAQKPLEQTQNDENISAII